MYPSRTLLVEFQGYWHVGTGRSSGTHVDALTEKDDQGLPFVPGRHLKGLLRHALRLATAWHWLDAITLPDGPASTLEILLFGSVSQSGAGHDTLPGLLRIDNARLPTPEWAYLALPEQAPLRQYLYRDLYSTAINDQGSAQAHSLRGIQVAVPMTLESRLDLWADAGDPALRDQQQAWLQEQDPWRPLTDCLPLIDSLGADRTRGLGEARLSLHPGTLA